MVPRIDKELFWSSFFPGCGMRHILDRLLRGWSEVVWELSHWKRKADERDEEGNVAEEAKCEGRVADDTRPGLGTHQKW